MPIDSFFHFTSKFVIIWLFTLAFMNISELTISKLFIDRNTKIPTIIFYHLRLLGEFIEEKGKIEIVKKISSFGLKSLSE